MITAIAKLGETLRGESDTQKESDIEDLVDSTNARNVIVLKFKIKGNRVEYFGIDLQEKGDDGLYLYRRQRGTGTGLFLTSNVKRSDLQKFKKNLVRIRENKESQEFVESFLKRKLDRPFQCGIATNTDLLSTLNQGNKDILDSLINEIKRNSKKISSDFCSKIQTFEPEELLITPKLVDRTQEYFLGQIPEYVNVFRLATTGLKKRGKKAKQPHTSPTCAKCNKVAVISEFSQTPLPFFTTDKPSFIPNGDKNQAYKVFPLCSDCRLDLRRGYRFIKNNLDFWISSINGRQAEVRFWLIPVFNNYSDTVMEYIKDLGESTAKTEGGESLRFLYLKHLRNMCETMEAITTVALDSEFEAVEVFLTFIALFYSIETQDYMKLVLGLEGIYPSRLRFMADAKKRVDALYPFEKVGVRFGFPLLREFLMPTESKGGKPSRSEGWYKDLASVLGDMFVGEPVNKPLIYKALAKKIWERAKEANLKTIMDTSFKALSLVEYIEYLESPELEKNFMDSHSEVEKHDQISQIKEFMDAHKGLLRDDTLRAVCATGVATGILLEVQRKRSEGESMPFWGRLNRLEMDFERVRQLFPQVINKLHEYDESEYNDVLAYLGSAEISRLDWSRRDLPEDIISLAFTVGIAQGYWMIRKSGGE